MNGTTFRPFECEGPVWPHDNECCHYLGSVTLIDGLYDLYFCPQHGIPTVIARFGSDNSNYTSGIGVKHAALDEARLRASEAGLWADPAVFPPPRLDEAIILGIVQRYALPGVQVTLERDGTGEDESWWFTGTGFGIVRAVVETPTIESVWRRWGWVTQTTVTAGSGYFEPVEVYAVDAADPRLTFEDALADLVITMFQGEVKRIMVELLNGLMPVQGDSADVPF